MKFDIKNLKWTREPKSYTISDDKIEITTAPQNANGSHMTVKNLTKNKTSNL